MSVSHRYVVLPAYQLKQTEIFLLTHQLIYIDCSGGEEERTRRDFYLTKYQHEERKVKNYVEETFTGNPNKSLLITYRTYKESRIFSFAEKWLSAIRSYRTSKPHPNGAPGLPFGEKGLCRLQV